MFCTVWVAVSALYTCHIIMSVTWPQLCTVQVAGVATIYTCHIIMSVTWPQLCTVQVAGVVPCCFYVFCQVCVFLFCGFLKIYCAKIAPKTKFRASAWNTCLFVPWSSKLCLFVLWFLKNLLRQNCAKNKISRECKIWEADVTLIWWKKIFDRWVRRMRSRFLMNVYKLTCFCVCFVFFLKMFDHLSVRLSVQNPSSIYIYIRGIFIF
jgi:hypothetical protein